LFCALFNRSNRIERTSMKKAPTSVIKPRNPLVAAARFRRAGAHARHDTTRQAAQMRLRKEVQALKEGP
jgi:hypothetical protein